jgi:hypothetical protein
MKNVLTETPFLRMSMDAGVYIFSHSTQDTLCELQIRFAYHGDGISKDGAHGTGDVDELKNWLKYKRIVRSDGGEYELVSDAEWKERMEAVLEHEGEDAVNEVQNDDRYRAVFMGDEYYRNWRVFEALIERWESMLRLRLFRPTVTHSDRWDWQPTTFLRRDSAIGG